MSVVLASACAMKCRDVLYGSYLIGSAFIKGACGQ